jgi:hypothetical protein
MMITTMLCTKQYAQKLLNKSQQHHTIVMKHAVPLHTYPVMCKENIALIQFHFQVREMESNRAVIALFSPLPENTPFQ